MNRLFITASVFALAILFPATILRAESTWLRNLDAPDKAEQMRHTWTAYGGQMDIQFNHDLLHDLGIRVNDMPPRGVNWQSIHRRFGISEAGGLGLQVPYGIMESVRDGSLSVNGDLRISRGEKTLRIGPFRLKPVPKQEKSGDFRALQMRDDQGNLLFTLDHIHLTVDTRNQMACPRSVAGSLARLTRSRACTFQPVPKPACQPVLARDAPCGNRRPMWTCN